MVSSGGFRAWSSAYWTMTGFADHGVHINVTDIRDIGDGIETNDGEVLLERRDHTRGFEG